MAKIAKQLKSDELTDLIVKGIQEKKGKNIVQLNLKGLSGAVTDYFVICEANSSTQVGAIKDSIEKEVKKACGENPQYRACMDRWLDRQSKLRYSGGMVPDLHHILSKGHGIFTYPRDEKHPNGKLRLLFEGAPFAFLFNEANGVGKTQEGGNILDIEVVDYHQNTTVFVGSKNEVKAVTDMLA